nr:RNA-directed DNA polymerase, eukaryota [Tanacetum cinerariifolium]
MILFRSKEVHVIWISMSVFVTNFPDSFGSRDLWSLCEEYGKVVDVFIPNLKSKAGKRFAFVRFIGVDDMDRLIGNLCTLWVGRLHLLANAVRYERPPKSSPSVKLPFVKSYAPFTSSPSGSFADAVKDNKNVPPHSSPVSCSPALVLDDTCVNVWDVTKNVNSIPNLRTILTNEGFMDVKLSYLGGLWVMIELNSEETKMKLLQHTGVNSWFEELKPASQEFVCNERIVWVDIEGIPLHLWSSSTFSRIGMKWGTVMDIEESSGSSFARKRLCIKTSMAVNILKTFKVIYKGKVFMVRAKELFTWSPCFLEYKDPGYLSEDESSLDGNNNLGNSQHGNVNQVEESDVDGVSDTIFEVSPQALRVDVHEVNEKANSHHLDDPFGLYDLLRKSTNLSASKDDLSLSHPPGYTPVASHQDPIHSNSAHLEVNQDEPPIAKGSSSKSYPKASCFSQASHGNDSSADSSTHVSSRSTPKARKISNKSSGYKEKQMVLNEDPFS